MIIFDIETNGLNPDKIHCLSYTRDGELFINLFQYDDMRELLLSGEPLLGHNIIRYDIPVLEKILNIKIKSRLYDTLPMSWVMNPTRSKHGLDSFFPDFGIEKVGTLLTLPNVKSENSGKNPPLDIRLETG